MSILQRLALGFALLSVIVLGFAVHVHGSVEDARAQFLHYDSVSNKRLALAAAYERDTLLASVSLRSYLAFPTEAYRMRMNDAFVAAHDSLETLATEVPRAADGAPTTEPLRGALTEYIELARAYVDSVRVGDPLGDLEQRLTLAREQMLARNRQFAVRLEDDARRHLAQVEAELHAMARRVTLTAGFALALFAVFSLLLAISIRRPLGRMVEAARHWQSGDHESIRSLAREYTSASHRQGSELQVLITTLGDAADAVHRREERLSADMTVCRQMMSSLVNEELAIALLEELVRFLDAAGGVLYEWKEDEQHLTALAGHRLRPLASPIPIGDGLLGATARSGEITVLKDVPAGEELHVQLGYDVLQPSHVAAVPVHFGTQLLAVFVVVRMQPFAAPALDFLQSAANLFALGLHNANSHRELSRLLDELRASNDEIQRANVELQAQNEEIQAQHEELQAQNEEIQAQNEEIQAQHGELEEQNRRLAEVSENLSRHSEEIEAADRRKTEFLAILAHELRNPMAPISTSVSLLRRSCPNEERTLSALATIERQSNHLIRLIEDLLDVTRISRGKIELRRNPFNLVALVADCVEDHRQAIEAKQVAVSLSGAGQSLWVDGDADRIVQVVGNLLHNAIKFTDKGGHISVEIEGDESNVTVTVSDSGCGMSEDLMRSLFQPFAQGPSGLDRKHGGLGLGLALVKGLVEQHGGSVTASSPGANAGSRFTVTLPRHRHAPGAAKPESETETGTQRPVKRILIVDDNVDAAKMLQMALEWDGYEIAVVHDGLAVAKLADDFRPDVILCDIGLPGIDGFEVARRLRATELHRGVSLIAITGYATDADRELSRQAGFDQHLVKPVDLAKLSELLRSMAVPARDGNEQAASD